MTSLAASSPAALARIEEFLFDIVGPHFRETGEISPEDFWIILIWKANRAKGMARWRIENGTGLSWNNAVREIAKEIATAENDEARLKALMSERWKFRLPTASAILTVLYPDRFSVYDVRACETLKADRPEEDHYRLDWPHTDETWTRYLKFLAAVRSAGPAPSTLREKDHYLWGSSLLRSVKTELATPAKPPKSRKRRETKNGKSAG